MLSKESLRTILDEQMHKEMGKYIHLKILQEETIN